jgi:hypothetical protein
MKPSTACSGIFAALSVAVAAASSGCGEIPDGTAGVDQGELLSANGLSMINGLSMVNGLDMGNGLNSTQALSSDQGLSSSKGMMTSSYGRSTVAYLVRCALPLGRRIVKHDQNGSRYTFWGALGLTPEWENNSCGDTCQRWITACMLAHVNTAGVHVPIWLVGQNPAVGWGQTPVFPNQEGTFFGNIFQINTAGHVDAYYCDGPGFDKGVVEGRIGANQVGAPYRNLFASKYCNINGCVPSDAKTNGLPDGYKVCAMGDGAMRAWNETITVWRQ